MSQQDFTLSNFSQLLSYKPLYFIFLKIWILLFGPEAFSVRFPSVIFGCMAVWAIYYLGKEFCDKRVGLIAAFLLAINCFHIYHSQQTRHFTLLVLISIFSYLFFLRALRQKNNRSEIFRIIFLNIVMIFIHPYAWTLVFAQMVCVFFFIKGNNRRQWYSFYTLGGIFFVLWVVMINKNQIWHNIWWVPKSGLEAFGETFQTFVYGGYRYGLDDYLISFKSPGIILFLFLCWMFFFLRGIFSKHLFERTSSFVKSSVLIWIFFPIILAWLISFIKPIFIIKHLIICMPAFCLITAMGIIRLGDRWKIFFVLGVIFIMGLYPLSIIYFQNNNIDWRSAVYSVKASIGQDDAIIVATSSELAPFLYYFGSDPRQSLHNYFSSYYCRMGMDGHCRDVFSERGHRVMGIPQNQGKVSDCPSCRLDERLSLWVAEPPLVVWLMVSRWESMEDKLYLIGKLDIFYHRQRTLFFHGVEVIKFIIRNKKNS
ncbi:MAG: glycosyltransferase family 39 protein [Candidatus Omnitrophota bacterium]